MSHSNSIPIVVVTAPATRADLRERVTAILREMADGGTVLSLTGAPDALVSEIVTAAATDTSIRCIVVHVAARDAVIDLLENHEGQLFSARFPLLGVVAVLDTVSFWAEFTGSDAEEVQELIFRIESASLVMLADAGAVPDEIRQHVEGFVRNLNPAAVVITDASLQTQTLASIAAAIDATEQSAEQSAEYGDPDEEALAGETDAWGFNSFTWTTNERIDRGAFLQLFEEWPSEILRAHGVLRMDDGIVHVSAIRDLVTLDEYDALDLDEDDLASEESELAFVGIDLPVSELVARLEACQTGHA